MLDVVASMWYEHIHTVSFFKFANLLHQLLLVKFTDFKH